MSFSAFEAISKYCLDKDIQQNTKMPLKATKNLMATISAQKKQMRSKQP
jgi:hypothetical protein